MQLYPDQEEIAAEIERFVHAAQPGDYFTVHGLAGTGKTTLLGEIARRHPSMLMVAPTGKAATVLSRRSGRYVSTIHSAIYTFRGLVDDERRVGRKNPVFTDKEEDLGNVVLLDECSMVGERLATDLLDRGAAVVAFGDPGQLPPVGDKLFFTEPTLSLTQIRRQALESPIIRQAHRVRGGEPYEGDGEDFLVLSQADAKAQMRRVLFDADIALCYLNKTRLYLNEMKRILVGRKGPLQVDEPVMCLRNSETPTRGLNNGEIFYMARERVEGSPDIWLKDELGISFRIPFAVFEGDDLFDQLQYDDGVVPFALAYAATVHKSQGSEWDNVLLLDEYDRRSEKRQFLYTGITRAVKRCTVVRCLR